MIPLAERIRPRRLDEVIGQEALLEVLRPLLAAGKLPSLLLWGPPGCGKTTLARLLAEAAGLHFASLSAVLSGVADVREAVQDAEDRRHPQDDGESLFANPQPAAPGPQREVRGTLLFIDEIHRFSKAQQDALLPHIESGLVTFVGATTENPSFAVIKALLSRCRTFPLAGLDEAALHRVLDRALTQAEGLPGAEIEPAARAALVRLAAGDARRLLVMLESAHALSSRVTTEAVARIAQQAGADHDRAGDAHYDVASAFIKSMRASDAQAALYYLARQLESGEDPAFVARRVVIFASEDVGLADPQALVVAVAALTACQNLGMPEAIYPLTQAVLYNATAPKSNSAKGYFAAAAAVREHPGARVPMHLRNAPTALMREAGHGRGYRYDHDEPDHFSGQECLPAELRGSAWYVPGAFGHEKEIARRIAWWERLRRERQEG